jgi:hypothetical protein
MCQLCALVLSATGELRQQPSAPQPAPSLVFDLTQFAAAVTSQPVGENPQRQLKPHNQHP